MSTTTALTTKIEDWLPYLLPVVVALAGFNWASILPGTNNPFLVAVAFGFLAKFLVGIEQNGWKSWEDWIPTLIISIGFLSTILATNADYLAYATVLGFVVKALGTFDLSTPSSYLEDGILAVGAFLILYGTYRADPIGATLVGFGSLLALIGKTIPSIGVPATPSLAPAPTPGA